MLIPLTILSFLKNNWEWVALGVIALLIVGYVTFLKLSLDYYKADAEAARAELNAYKVMAQARMDEFEARSNQISQAANNALAEKNKIIFVQAEQLMKRIQNDQAIARISVPRESVRLLNESASAGPAPGTTQGTSQEASAGKAGASAADEVSLTTIFEVVVENNTNHQQCIEQVLSLQDWYNKLRKESLHENPT